MKLGKLFTGVATAIGLGAVVAYTAPDAIKRVNDAHQETAGGKQSLLAQWIKNAPPFDQQKTFAGFIKKHGPTLERVFKEGPKGP